MASGYASIEPLNGHHSDSDSRCSSSTGSERNVYAIAYDRPPTNEQKHQQRQRTQMTDTHQPIRTFDGEQSDTKSYHDGDEVITINYDPKQLKTGYHSADTATTTSSSTAAKSSSFLRKYHIDTFAKYKQCLLQENCGIRRRSCLPLFRFKSEKHERLFPLFVDQRYRIIHYGCLLLMLVQVFALYFIHISLEVEDEGSSSSASWQQFALDTDFYAMLAFVVTLFVLLIAAIVCDQCECCHAMENDIVPRYSTTAFTTGVGLILLYIIIMYTVVGSLTTDRFLVYFVVTLTWNACIGHVRATHFAILAFTAMVEYALFATLRWQRVITIGASSAASGNDDNWLLSAQVEGHITDAEFVFASLAVVFTVLYVGALVGRQQRQLCFEYIQTVHMQQYIRHGKIGLSALATQILDGYHLKMLSDLNVEFDANSDAIHLNGDSNGHVAAHDAHEPSAAEMTEVLKPALASRKNRNASVHSDDISKLSSLHTHTLHAVKHHAPIVEEYEAEYNADASSSDSDSMSSMSQSVPNIAAPPQPSPDLNSPLRYSLSTTYPNQSANLARTAALEHDDSNHSPQHGQQHLRRIESGISIHNVLDALQLDANANASDQDADGKFHVLQLLATCKFAAERAGEAVVQIFNALDTYEHVGYNESRSFEQIDSQWLENKKKLARGKDASQRGMMLNSSNSSKKKKKKPKAVSDSDSSDMEQLAASSPFKQKLPAFIKDSKLFHLSPKNAALSLSNAIITTAVQTHFAQVNMSYPNDVHIVDVNGTDVVPQFIDVARSKRRKLLTEDGENVLHELQQRSAELAQHLSVLDRFSADDITLWIEPLDGVEAMSKKKKKSRKSVTIMVGISDSKRAIAGLIFRPFTQQSVVGIPTLGHWTYGMPLVSTLLTNKLNAKRKRIVVVGYHYSETAKQYIIQRCPKHDQLALEGGFGHNTLRLLEHHSDAFLHPDHESTYKWHTCSIEAVILSMDGHFTQTDGKSLEYSDHTTRLKKGFIATLNGRDYHQQYQYKLYFP